MENEFMNRGYLLPEGCKDLVDVLKSKEPFYSLKSLPAMTSAALMMPMDAYKSLSLKFKGMLTVPAQVSVLQLATMLNQNMSQILADLLKIGGLAAIKEQLDFVTVSKIAWKYGFIARKAKK